MMWPTGEFRFRERPRDEVGHVLERAARSAITVMNGVNESVADALLVDVVLKLPWEEMGEI